MKEQLEMMNEEQETQCHLVLLNEHSIEQDTKVTRFALYEDKLRERKELCVTVKHKLFKDQWADRCVCFHENTAEYDLYKEKTRKEKSTYSV